MHAGDRNFFQNECKNPRTGRRISCVVCSLQIGRNMDHMGKIDVHKQCGSEGYMMIPTCILHSRQVDVMRTIATNQQPLVYMALYHMLRTRQDRNYCAPLSSKTSFVGYREQVSSVSKIPTTQHTETGFPTKNCHPSETERRECSRPKPKQPSEQTVREFHNTPRKSEHNTSTHARPPNNPFTCAFPVTKHDVRTTIASRPKTRHLSSPNKPSNPLGVFFAFASPDATSRSSGPGVGPPLPSCAFSGLGWTTPLVHPASVYGMHRRLRSGTISTSRGFLRATAAETSETNTGCVE